jgi:RHS repeat-associated protein
MSGSFEGAGGVGGLLAFSQLSAGSPEHTYYYHADGNANLTMLINSTQVAVARYLDDAFGNPICASGPLAEANACRFSSKELQVTSGAIYYLYRYYDPKLHRWINTDPISERGFQQLARNTRSAQ